MTSDAQSATGSVESLQLLTLHNDVLSVGVAAQVGRILELTPAGGENLLWRDAPRRLALARRNGQYRNWGGDKVWPCQQLLWVRQRRGGGTEPPIAPIDGGPWQLIDQSERQIVMRSAVDEDLAAHVTRTIALDPALPGVSITNTIQRIAPSPLPVMIWSVSQVRRPRGAMLHVSPDRPAREWPVLEMGPPQCPAAPGITLFDQAAMWRPPGLGVYKIGTFGRWIAGLYEGRIFLQSTRYDPQACYPDRSNIQMFCNGSFMELETISPAAHLKAGQSLSNTVQWRLLDPPPLDGAPLAAYLDEQAN